MSFQHWPAPGSLALYHLADVNDSSGNSHTLTNAGAVTFVAGKLGDCAEFGSSNSSKYLVHSDGLGEDLSGDASISIWVLIETAPASGEIQTIARWGSTTGTSRFFYLNYANAGGTLQLQARCSESSASLVYNVTLALNTWYKLDFNFNSTCELFLNGASVGTTSRGTSTTTTDNICVGASFTGSALNYLNGRADEAVFFSAARLAADIRRRYAFERGMLA